jgi:MYXO-CTERM domain-containing protein
MPRPEGILLGLLAALGTAPAAAAPASVKLSWASQDAATTIAVTWVTSADAPTVIEYGIQAVSEHSLTGNAAQELPGIGWIHEIELSGLIPNTTYRYRVGAPGDFSPEYTFRTAPNDQCEPFVFVSLGDARSQNNRGPSLNWSSIHQEAEAAGGRFILNGGDLVREGQEIAQWAAWLQDSEAVNPRIPMLPCIGNHDDGPGDGESANYNRLFALPRNTVTGTEDYFAVVYNNLLVFSLSTQTYEDYQAQADWVRQVAAMHPTKWKIVFFHHPVFTTQTTIVVDVGHPPNEKGQNPFYGPAFDEAGIDVVVGSHNHIYERFRPLRYDPANPGEGREVPAYGTGPNDGRLYVVSGGAGAFLDPLIESRFTDFAPGSEARSKDHHFLKFAVAGSTLQMSAVRTFAGNSSGGGTVIDTVTLTRPGPDPCSTPMDPDGDGDGFPASRDCDDGDPAINPGAAEVCGNTLDEDCSGSAEMCPPPPVDADGDGSPAGTDCDDNEPRRFPENPELECDGVDNNCDCLEVCAGQSSDLCNPPPPDAGTTAAPDAEPPPPGPDAQAPVPPLPEDASVVDQGEVTTLPADGCSCSASAPGHPGPAALLLVALLLLRRRVK